MASALDQGSASSTERRSGADAYAEQRVFALSPLNLWLTAALLFLILAGAYALAALADGRALMVRTAGEPALERQAQIALVLILIVCAVLALQRWSNLKEVQERPAMARVLGPDLSWSPQGPPVTGLRLMTGLGVAVSLVANLLYLPRHGDVATYIWFTLVSALLSVLFFRGIVLTRMGSRHAAAVVRTLNIDLLRIDDLYPWGRAAARTALIWFTVSAATCLLFVGGGLTLYTLALLVGCAGIGVWVFVGGLSLVHHRIREAKTAALDDVRSEIAALKADLHRDPAAPAKLQSLLAYEARIASAPEWPFDQTILVRLGASAMILTVPWFGQALAGLVVEHLGKALQ
jgi:hypothetical protein